MLSGWSSGSSTMEVLSSENENDSKRKCEDQQRRVGLLYDERMCKHYTPDQEYHPENPNRIKVIWNKLHSYGLTQRLLNFTIFFLLNMLYLCVFWVLDVK